MEQPQQPLEGVTVDREPGPGRQREGCVTDETQARVLDACRRLQYRPNVAARCRRLGRSDAVVLVVPAIGFEFFSDVLAGVEALADAADAADVSVMVAATENDAERQTSLEQVLSDLDGLLLCAVDDAQERTVDFKGPVIALESRPSNVPWVGFDHDAIGREIVGHRCPASSS